MGADREQGASGRPRNSPGEDRGDEAAARAGDRCPDEGYPEERCAEERFIDGLVARGEAVPEGQDLPPGATHRVFRTADGRRAVRRVRFR
ncbi:hypothetical protein [Peterkaempfera sp. SMS 1(5)a]|uniref:hypothetical protein n=1 Tax=Peterkaempfera podocarpi TaxID=3232308 RepID=UPI00366EC104